MKKLGIVGILAAIGLVGVACVGLLLGSFNKGVRFENNLKAFQAKGKNTLSTLANSLQSQGVVSEKYTSAVESAIKAASTGRYGASGVKAVALSIKEANIPVNDTLFVQWAAKADALWASYQADQNTVLDEVRRYRNWLQDPTTVITRTIGGFPRIKLEEFEEIVVTEEADRAYKTKRVNAKDIMTPK